jgi:hypothetical protein
LESDKVAALQRVYQLEVEKEQAHEEETKAKQKLK